MNVQNMIFKLLVNLIPIIAAIYIIVGSKLFKKKLKNEINYFSFLMFAAAIYSFGYFLELNWENLNTFLLVRNFEFLGTVFIPSFGVLFIAELTEVKISKKLKSVLFSISTLLWLLFISNPFHHLIYTSIDVRIIGGFNIIKAVRGPAFFSMLIYYIAFLIFSIIVLRKVYRSAGESNKKNSLLFLIKSFQIPWFAIILILLDFDIYVDTAVVTIMILAGLFTINEIKNNMFEFQIKMWKGTYENIGEAAFLIDKVGTIVCTNIIAKSLFYNQGKSIHDIIGNLDAGEINRNQVFFQTNIGIRWFDVKKSKFDIKRGFVSYLLIDISDGKFAEERLRESEEKYRMIFENAPLGLLYFDNSGFITDCNDNFGKIIGVPREQLLGLDMLKLPDENLVQALQGTLKGKITRYEGDYKSTTADKVTPVKIIFAPITSDDKEDKTGVGIIEDVTESKLAEDVLKQTHQNYETFFNSIDDFLFVLDEQGFLIHTNSTVIHRLGYTESEFLGKSVFMFHSEERREEARSIALEILSGIAEFSTVPIVTKSGKQISVETRITRGFWDGKPVIFGVTKDVSKLALSEEKFSKLFHLNPSACGLTELDHKYIEVNEAFYSLLGFDKNEVIGKSVANLGIMTTEEINKLLLKVDCNENIMAVEVDLKAKNGDLKHVLLSSEIIYLQDKKYRFTAANDVTEIKQKQEEIERLSYYDQLTGLYNRRFYEEELKRLDRTRNLPLTIVMGDVNGLKIVNDSFGHIMGDQLLKKVAGVIKLGCRDDDIIARLGGDEFVIILPKTDGFEAEQIIKRINELSLKEKIGSIDISISFGYETKYTEEEKTEEIFKKAEDHMYKKKLFESPSMRGKAISAIIKTLHEKNKREEQHSHRVSELCKSMGEALKLSEYEIQELKTIGLLHDIGKIAIDENILNKAGKLTDAEWNEIKRHPEIGYRILNTVNDMSDMARLVLHHHERWDGKGYPKGLKGNEIPFVSRIITIVDAYDAMTSERSYRSALPNEVAVEELQKNMGIQFDSELVKVFIKKVLLLH